MAALIHLDTHVVAWLYAGARRYFPAAVWDTLQDHDLAVSPMVRLELQYLHEIGRLSTPGSDVMDDLRRRLALAVVDQPFPDIIQVAMTLSWTRDPFDRLIVAQAELDGAALLTKDQLIRSHYPRAVWAPDG
jgi:PIN domain nuclease of toxin-antitoxin system